MTALELYNATLIELNKVNAPTFTVEQFNYFINKAIQSYTDKRYNFYAMNQQLTDDLRVLLTTYQTFNPAFSSFDTGEVVLWHNAIYDPPEHQTDYVSVWHLDYIRVGEQVMFEGSNSKHTVTKLYPEGTDQQPDVPGFSFEPAFSLYYDTSGGGGTDPAPMDVSVQDDSSASDRLFGKKVYWVPRNFKVQESLSNEARVAFNLEVGNYYHILGVRTYWTDKRGSTRINQPNPCSINDITEVSRMYPAKRLTYDMLGNIENNAYLRPMIRQPYYQLHDHYLNTGVEKVSDTEQYQNTPFIEVHYGKPIEGITLQMVEVDYLKLPEHVVLEDEEVYINNEDKSQLLEWPDYLNSDLISILVSYFLENENNPRIQTFPALQQDTPPAPFETGGGG